MKKLYVIVGVMLLLGGLGLTAYIYSLQQTGYYYTSNLNYAVAVFLVLFGIGYITIPEIKINKVTNSSLWLLIIAMVIGLILWGLAASTTESASIYLGGTGLVLSVLLMLISVVVFLIGRYKS